MELSGLGKRWSSFWRKSSNRKVSGDSGGFEFRAFLEFLDAYTGFVRRLFYALSGFNHDAHFGPSSFVYSDLTASITCWSPHALSTGGRSSRNRICFNQIFYTAISTSWTLERGPCRKTLRRHLRPLLIVIKGFTSHQRMFRRRETPFRLSQSAGSSGGDWSFWF